MESNLLTTVSGDESSTVVGLHVLSTDYVHGSEGIIEDLSTDDCSRGVIAIPSLSTVSSGSMLEKEAEITLNSSFIPENAVLMETPRGLMLTVPENISAVAYGEDSSPNEQSQQLLSCIPVSLFSTCDTAVDGDSNIEYTAEISTNTGTVMTTVRNPPKTATCEDKSDTASAQPAIHVDGATEVCVTTKRKGGWPKGKKRKIKPVVVGPRAPVTGYVLYAMDRRKEIKESHPEIEFPEVTKILGQEWSNMAPEVKEKYLAAAEEDKKRYREELKTFKSSETYRETVRKKRLMNGMGTQRTVATGEMGSLQESTDVLNCEEEYPDELHCKLCNVYFSNLHNKREHMYGKVHIQNLTGAMEKQLLKEGQEEQTYMNGSLVVSEELSQESFPSRHRRDSHGSISSTGETSHNPVDIHGFMMDFICKNYERENEISVLKRCLSKALQDNVTMCKEIQVLQEYQNKLEEEQKTLDASNSALIAQSDALKIIPTLFGIINL